MERRSPLKIKIFTWQLARDRLPSTDQILKYHGPSCALCGEEENVLHICPVTLHISCGVASASCLGVTGIWLTLRVSLLSFKGFRLEVFFGFTFQRNVGLYGILETN